MADALVWTDRLPHLSTKTQSVRVALQPTMAAGSASAVSHGPEPLWSEVTDMPTLEPEMPFLTVTVPNLNFSISDLLPPVLSPALDLSSHKTKRRLFPDLEVIEGMEFRSFETEDDLNLFTSITSFPSLPSPPPLTIFPVKKKLGRPKGSKTKNKSKKLLNDSLFSNQSLFSFCDLTIIQDTCWDRESPLSEDALEMIYAQYVRESLDQVRLSKALHQSPIVMDDLYARFALTALQSNQHNQHQLSVNSFQSPEICDSTLEGAEANVKLSTSSLSMKSPPTKRDVKQELVTKRRRKNQDADIANIFAMNRSKRQIRLPSRFHESSLLMGNQWIIPDFEEKGKMGKRRLHAEQKRLKELHQKQLEIEKRNQVAQKTNDQMNYKRLASEMSLLVPKKFGFSANVPVQSKELFKKSESGLKIPNIRFKTIMSKRKVEVMKFKEQNKKYLTSKRQQIREGPWLANKTDCSVQTAVPCVNGNSFSIEDKNLSVLKNPKKKQNSNKAIEAVQARREIRLLFMNLTHVMRQEKSLLKIGETPQVKLSHLEILNQAIDYISKLKKREQQLNYIKKLLAMWNKKLQVCAKVVQKDMKPEAIKIVNEVMSAYRNSVCYKVEEALEAKQREAQQRGSVTK